MNLDALDGTIQYTPITPAFGAEVEGIDLARMTTTQFRRVYQLWQQQQVLVFRRQSLAPHQFRRLAAMLGEIEPTGVAGEPNEEWHSDMPWMDKPPFASLLWAEEMPAGSGAMWFASMSAALRSMPADLVSRLNALPLQHGPVTVHPLVVVQPETGEPALYLGRRMETCIPGVAQVESDRVLNILWSYATAVSVTMRHHWHAGDVVLWNNLTTMHRSEPGPAHSLRKVHVARVRGRYTLSAPIQQEAA